MVADRQVARQHADEYCTRQLGFGASNMRFVEGHIEYLDAAGIADESVRLLTSSIAPLAKAITASIGLALGLDSGLG